MDALTTASIHSHHACWLHLPDHKADLAMSAVSVWQKLNRYLAMSPVGTLIWRKRPERKVTYAAGAAAGKAAQQASLAAIVKDRYYRNGLSLRQYDPRAIKREDRVRRISRQAECRAETAIQILEYFGPDWILHDVVE